MLDGAIAIFDSVAGVEPQSETVWRQADKYKVPRVAYVNKMDRTGADFFGAVETMRERLGANPLPIQIPIGNEADFTGVVDLIENKALVWKDELGTEFEYEDVPEDLKELAHEHRTHLIEACADYDDELMEAYLNDEEIPHERIAKSLHRATLDIKVTPGPLRLLVQEQGRAAAAGRDRRAAALAARGAADDRDGARRRRARTASPPRPCASPPTTRPSPRSPSR